MKKLLITMMAFMLMVGINASADAATPTDTINVTVTITASGVSVVVTPDAWAISDIDASDSPTTVGIGPDFFTALNDSNASEDLTLSSASSDDWTFANTPGADQFGMNFSTGGAFPVWNTIDSSTGGELATGLGAGAVRTFDLQLEAPTSTTVGGTEQTIVVTVTAS